MSGNAHHHRREATRISAQIEDDAVVSAEPVYRPGKRSIDRRHPDVEANDPRLAPGGSLLLALPPPHQHRRQAAALAGGPFLRVSLDRHFHETIGGVFK